MKTGVKRIIALCVCCLLLAAAIVQNVYSNKKKAANDIKPSNLSDSSNKDNNGSDVLSKDPDKDVGTDTDGNSNEQNAATGLLCSSTEDFMAELRINRDESRSAEAEECMAVIENANANADEKTRAQETVQSISIMQEIESSVETAIKGKGYKDAFVSYDKSGSFDVTIVAETMTENEVMSIAMMIQDAAGVSLECLSVQSVYDNQA